MSNTGQLQFQDGSPAGARDAGHRPARVTPTLGPLPVHLPSRHRQYQSQPPYRGQPFNGVGTVPRVLTRVLTPDTCLTRVSSTCLARVTCHLLY